MILRSKRFGEVQINEKQDVIQFPQGLLGFAEHKRFCILDPNDDTFLLWLISLDDPNIALPVLDPKIFKPDYSVKLSGFEMRELGLEQINHAAVFSVVTIPETIQEMTANIKAPIVINLKSGTGKQVVLQENDYNIKHPIFSELRIHIATLRAQRPGSDARSASATLAPSKQILSLTEVPASANVRPIGN